MKSSLYTSKQKTKPKDNKNFMRLEIFKGAIIKNNFVRVTWFQFVFYA